jgi:4-hydroxy-3-methylbut-2-en-1-yl diphosphate synthase IspG/GcpE
VQARKRTNRSTHSSALSPVYCTFSSAISGAKKILSSCQVFPRGYTIISCPMCGRYMFDIETLTKTIEKRLSVLKKQYKDAGRRLEDIGGITVAVMGCNVTN